MASGRRVLITGVSRFLGLRLAKRLEQDESIEHLVGVDVEEPPFPIDGMEFVRVDIRNPLIARVLEATKVDTLIHTNIASTPGRLGGRSQMKESNVIGTMQLLAAAQRAERIKKVVMKSSTAIYGFGPGEPSILGENLASRHVDLSGYSKDCAEAEQYARDFGRRRPDVDLVILRTQNLLGPTIHSNIGDYFSLPLLPTALGYDPRLQFLHEEDAVDALWQVATADCRGIFNVAAEGVVYLSKAIRMLGKLQLPLLLPAAQLAAEVLRQFRVVDFPTDQLNLIVYGRVVDTSRAKKAFGFSPRWTTEETLIDFKDHRAPEREPTEGLRPSWERELFEYLRQRSDSMKETV
jgi:UDP-glucose 4-epimerase